MIEEENIKKDEMKNSGVMRKEEGKGKVKNVKYIKNARMRCERHGKKLEPSPKTGSTVVASWKLYAPEGVTGNKSKSMSRKTEVNVTRGNAYRSFGVTLWKLLSTIPCTLSYTRILYRVPPKGASPRFSSPDI
jgi:hypothetical protein